LARHWKIIENETDQPLLDFIAGNDTGSDAWHSDFIKWLDYFWSARDFRTCLDIGANIGCTTLPFARKFQHVHSFEMQSDVFECLKHNCQDYNNITLHNVAVAEKQYSGFYEIQSQGSGHVFLHPRTQKPNDSMLSVEAIRLDDHVWWEVDFIKIDVEGQEQRVLDGARNTIMMHKPWIMVERHCTRLHTDIASRKRFFDYIKCIGYRIEDIRGQDFLLVPDKY